MKKIIFILSALALFMGAISAYSVSFYKDMQKNIIRFHILADNNSREAQNIKFEIRDCVLTATARTDIKTTEEFSQIAEATANEYLASNNLPYEAVAQSGIFHFPQKNYGNITLPSGNYSGIRLILGNGHGENWWCVMHPPICVGNNTEAMTLLKDSLYNGSYETITQRPQIRFRLLDWLNK